MTFLIVLLALILERFFHWHHWRYWRGCTLYERAIGKRLGRYVLSPTLALLVIVIPPLLLIFLLSLGLRDVLGGLIFFVLNAVIVLYCLGSENLWAEAKEGAQSSHGTHSEALARAIFVALHSRIFAVVFWFVLVGPIGAVLYRLVETTAKTGVKGADLADRAKQVLDWLPIRLLTIFFALAGHFSKVFVFWRHHVLDRPDTNRAFLTDCGLAALRVSGGDQSSESDVSEKTALALVDRALIIGLVILAMLFC